MSDLYDPKTHDVQFIAGDKGPMPVAGGGYAATSFKVGCIANPQIRYKDKLIEANLYRDGEGKMTLITICPRCLHQQKIESTNKDLHWDEETQRVSVEPYTCPWEMNTHIEVGVLPITNLCKLRVGISRGIMRDA